MFSIVLHLQALHDAVIKEFGKVDILVNAAGVTHKSPPWKWMRPIGRA